MASSSGRLTGFGRTRSAPRRTAAREMLGAAPDDAGDDEDAHLRVGLADLAHRLESRHAAASPGRRSRGSAGRARKAASAFGAVGDLFHLVTGVAQGGAEDETRDAVVIDDKYARHRAVLPPAPYSACGRSGPGKAAGQREGARLIQAIVWFQLRSLKSRSGRQSAILLDYPAAGLSRS